MPSIKQMEKFLGILKKVDSPEIAIALKGAEKKQYLEALDAVYGSANDRANKLGFSKDVLYHGSSADINQFIPSTSMHKYEPVDATYFTKNADEAASFVRQGESPTVYPVKVRGNSVNAKDLKLNSKTADKLKDNSVSRILDDRVGLEDHVAVAGPENIRSVHAAFDPRFKDSPLLLAGAAAAPAVKPGDINPLSALKTGFDKYEQVKKGVADTVANKLDFTPDKSQAAAFSQGISAIADPMNFVPGAPGAALMGAQLMSQGAPNYAKGGEVKGLDLSKFKKVNSDDNKTVFKHEDGHFLHVSHKKLKPGHVKELNKLGVQKFAHGGEAEDDSALNAEAQDAFSGNTPVETPSPVISNIEQPAEPSFADTFKASSLKGYNPEGMQEVLGHNQPEEERAPAEAQPGEINLGAAPQQAMQPDMSMSTPGLDSMRAGINNYAKAQGALGEANAKTIDEHEQSTQQLLSKNAETDAAYDQEHAALVKDIQDNNIDANHYFHSMSTAGKISTAVGLLLGGLGGIASGGKNLVLDAINKNIDQDLEAQKANQSGKVSLLAAMERHYGDKIVARNSAHAVQLESVKNELLKNANKAMGPMAQAQAQQAVGQIQNQIDVLGAQSKQRLQALNAVQSGDPNAAAKAIPALVPPAHQAAAFKELNEIKNIDAASQRLEKSMQATAKLQTLGHRMGSFIQSKSQIDALNLNVMGMAKELFGRVNEAELNQLLKKNTISFTDNPETIQKKTQVLLDLANEARNKNATLQAFDINLPQKPRTKPR